MAIIRSGRIHKGAELDAELVVLLVKQLQTLSGKKSYLGELSWQAEKSVLEKVNIHAVLLAALTDCIPDERQLFYEECSTPALAGV